MAKFSNQVCNGSIHGEVISFRSNTIVVTRYGAQNALEFIMPISVYGLDFVGGVVDFNVKVWVLVIISKHPIILIRTAEVSELAMLGKSELNDCYVRTENVQQID